MKKSLIALTLVTGTLGLGGCMGDYGYGGGYGGGVVMDYGSAYPYDGWYDGYYGNIYDGYWGNDGYFYYRGNDRDQQYRRGDRNHFRRDAPGQRNHNYKPFRGEMRPQQGRQMPHWNGGRPGGGRFDDQHGGRHRGH